LNAGVAAGSSFNPADPLEEEINMRTLAAVVALILSLAGCKTSDADSHVSGEIDGTDIELGYAQYYLGFITPYYFRDPTNHHGYDLSQLTSCDFELFSVPNPTCDYVPYDSDGRPILCDFLFVETYTLGMGSQTAYVTSFDSGASPGPNNTVVPPSRQQVQITKIETDEYGDPTFIDGTLNLDFGTHGTLSGSFHAKHCRNQDEGMAR
jgi:hypothetical protein